MYFVIIAFVVVIYLMIILYERTDVETEYDVLCVVADADDKIENVVKQVQIYDRRFRYFIGNNIMGLKQAPLTGPILQGFVETQSNKEDYLAVSLSVAKPIKQVFNYVYTGFSMVVQQFQRLSDTKQFFYVTMTQQINSKADDSERYDNLVKMIEILKKNHVGLYIIGGNFMVHKPKSVFEKRLSGNYHYCFSEDVVTTINNEMGIVSTIGLVVSKDLYGAVHYKFDLYGKANCTSHIMRCKLYKSSMLKTSDRTQNALKTYSTSLKDVPIAQKTYFIDAPSRYDDDRDVNIPTDTLVTNLNKQYIPYVASSGLNHSIGIPNTENANTVPKTSELDE